MTPRRLAAINRELLLRPPVNVLVASFLRYKPPEDLMLDPLEVEDGRQLLREVIGLNG